MVNNDPEPRRGDQGSAPISGRNVELERQNPDLLVPPTTDSRLVPNLKFSFSQAHTRVEKGGWTREVTIRDLPIATQLAGVQFGLEPGAYREIHWHQESEWAYMLSGRARISAVDHEGRNFIEDVQAGDLWFFPQGIPHHIQALADGAQFLLVFNDGTFSENNTFLLSDFFAHTPKSVLAKNFGWSMAQMADLAQKEKYIFQSAVPPPLSMDRIVSPTGDVPRSFKHRLLAQAPQHFRGGTVRIADSTNFAASTTTAAALVEVEPGGMRELHWHPTTDEWQYYISGRGRMGVFAGSAAARTFDFQAGDVGYVPFAYGHYIENTGDEPLVFLEMFRHPRFEDISVMQWMANTPHEVISDTINVSQSLVDALPQSKQVVL
ncbi:cupin domain-containing protein [Micromonospora sp. NPDC047793]|uniref:cupin domain-containing protein n=1 Tax=Micromonospora sp. NPDC047793 TaxID=3154342 RepID=UPI0033CFFF5F